VTGGQNGIYKEEREKFKPHRSPPKKKTRSYHTGQAREYTSTSF
jgi:hypothetical protein